MNAAGVSWWVRLRAFFMSWREYHFPTEEDSSIDWDDGEEHVESRKYRNLSPAQQLAHPYQNE